jgi:hypothetical protein
MMETYNTCRVGRSYLPAGPAQPEVSMDLGPDLGMVRAGRTFRLIGIAFWGNHPAISSNTINVGEIDCSSTLRVFHFPEHNKK